MKKEIDRSLKKTEGTLRYLRLAVFIVYVVILVAPQAFAFNPGDFGQNVANVAKQILQPLGWVIAVVKGAQVFTDEHNRVRNALYMIAGVALGFWDDTINFIKGLWGGQ